MVLPDGQRQTVPERRSTSQLLAGITIPDRRRSQSQATIGSSTSLGAEPETEAAPVSQQGENRRVSVDENIAIAPNVIAQYGQRHSPQSKVL